MNTAVWVTVFCAESPDVHISGRNLIFRELKPINQGCVSVNIVEVFNIYLYQCEGLHMRFSLPDHVRRRTFRFLRPYSF